MSIHDQGLRPDQAAGSVFAVYFAWGILVICVLGAGANALYRLDRQATLCPAFTQPPDSSSFIARRRR